ncbi:acyl-CoA N-acyltransferase [Podospora aff. communis PSN243]|uniref:Acyl-CoA N-acyltransferase n=1 Tax=Podospora aff. communis PSN243 TaxID=3040156 RepID=A0AAV9GCJ2_9PEZI|nr:acyl-CoA N-acyltransferase [Podospora aff. communis PSN243]
MSPPSTSTLPRRLSDHVSAEEPILKLPHPYQTPYRVAKCNDGNGLYQLQQSDAGTKPLLEPLHNPALSFTEPQNLKSGDRPNASDNTLWGRARRSPAVKASWKDTQPATIAQLWLLTYALFTLRPSEEAFRLELTGPNAFQLSDHLIAVGLAINHTSPPTSPPSSSPEILILRSAFWQGAASPFGPRPAWVPPSPSLNLAAYPPQPLDYTLTSSPTTLSWHPRRPSKPPPSTTLYSRYIPHLGETFSMVSLDPSDPTHVSLFHTWVNDPRVSQGWGNQSGTLDQHKAYLATCHADPHRQSILARFDDTFFAYFEVYWAKENPIGAYYSAGDFDRGRNSLVGDVRFRGPHRVSAWWSSLMHYLFLDETRTMQVVGEPQFTNSTVLMYDLIHGFGLEKFVDLPAKRAAFMSCSRERFFQLCPLGEGERVVGGTGVGLVPKL